MGLALYWLFVIGKIQIFVLTFAVLGSIFLGIFALIALIYWASKSEDYNDHSTESRRLSLEKASVFCKTKLTKISLRVGIIITSLYFIFCFTPSIKQLAVIFVVSKMEKTEFAEEAGKLPAKSMKILNKLLDSYLEDLEEDLKNDLDEIKDEVTNKVKEKISGE